MLRKTIEPFMRLAVYSFRKRFRSSYFCLTSTSVPGIALTIVDAHFERYLYLCDIIYTTLDRGYKGGYKLIFTPKSLLRVHVKVQKCYKCILEKPSNGHRSPFSDPKEGRTKLRFQVQRSSGQLDTMWLMFSGNSRVQLRKQRQRARSHETMLRGILKVDSMTPYLGYSERIQIDRICELEFRIE
ncbi:hypothetical protein V1478_005971 [Vespula squamosa]|uniref:Uncharacterized protein n=1 Tax=Vespula squamosa TaxID=30214 RepID=A0ABD2B908_VESSQ